MSGSSFTNEELQTVILDIGACSTKIGYSGEEEPRSVVPTLVGVPLHPDLPVFGCKSYYVGASAMENRGTLKLTRPIQGGIITDMNAIEQIIQCAMINNLCADPSQSNVLLTDKMLSPKKQREKLCELLFERFEVQGYYAGAQSLLPMYDLNKTTALIVDIGEDITEITPIHEGYVLRHQARRTTVSGGLVNKKLAQLLSETCLSGLNKRILVESLNDMELVRNIKEEVCSVALDCREQRMENEVDTTYRHYTLPDNTELILDEECFLAPEVLFEPGTIGSPCPGITTLIYDTVMSCPIETRRDFFENVVLIGGTSNMEGLGERIENDLDLMSAASVTINIDIPEFPDLSTWLGASSFSDSIQFNDGILTRAQFEEHGARLLHNKFYFDDRHFQFLPKI